MADLPPLPGLSEVEVEEVKVEEVKVEEVEVKVEEEEEEEEEEDDDDDDDDDECPPGLERPPPHVSKGNLRDGRRVSDTEQEEPEDDHYLYCEECKSFFLEKCAIHGPALFIADAPVALGVSDRARLTLPHGLKVRRSRILEAGLGVFNCGEAVAKGTHYGPYEGEVLEKEEAVKSTYSWVIDKSSNRAKYIDAKRDTHSNWMRYVNNARTEEEQNLVAFQHRGGILYRCCRPLSVGEELLVWYGQEYRYKSISFDYFWDNKSAGDRGMTSELSQTPVFSCSECPTSYTSEMFLHKHIKYHHDNLYVSLLRSGEISLKTLSSSSQSLPISTSNTPSTPTPAWSQKDTDKQRLYHCDQCGRGFDRAYNLKKHQRVHTGEKPYHCDQCGQNFANSGTLKTHQRFHRGELYHCDQCGKKYTRSEDLKRHQRVHTGEKPHHCDQCGKSFVYPGELKRHQRIHTGEKPFHCDQCGKKFSRSEELKTHQRVHTGEKPYHCDQCEKKFRQVVNLKRHQRVHTGEKPHNCDECGKNFKLAPELRRHQRVHTGEKPHCCDQCGKKFRQVSHLGTHQRIHTGEKPYHCEQCGKNFTRSGELKRHQRVHTGEKTHHCDQCGKSFAYSGGLKKHRCSGKSDVTPLK